MAGNELQDYSFIFLGKRRISAKCSCQANNADAHTHSGIEPPAFWLADDLCTPEPLCAAAAICIQFPGTGENKHSMFANRHMMTSALETELLMIEFLSETSPTCLLLLICISLYWTSSCVPVEPAKHTKLKLNLNWHTLKAQTDKKKWNKKVKEQKIIRSWTHGGNKMLLMIYDPEETKEEAGINCQKSHEKTPKKPNRSKAGNQGSKDLLENGENCGKSILLQSKPHQTHLCWVFWPSELSLQSCGVFSLEISMRGQLLLPGAIDLNWMLENESTWNQ